MAIRSAGRRHQAMQICPAAKSSVHVGLGTWSWGLLCSSLSSVQFARPVRGGGRVELGMLAGTLGRCARRHSPLAHTHSSPRDVQTPGQPDGFCWAIGELIRSLMRAATYPSSPFLVQSWKSLVKLSRLFAGVLLGGVDCCDHHPGNRAGTCIAVSGLASGMCFSARQVCWNAGEMALARIEMRYLFQA